MNPQENPVSQQNNISLIFLVFAFLGLLIRVINIGNPLNDWDETTYALVARSLMLGNLPYHEAFDHKPIGLYYIFALFFQIFGYSLTALRLMPFAAIGLTSWLLYRIAKKQMPPHQHFVALCAILFMTTCASFGNGGHASNTEILQMPVFAGWWLAALNCPESSWRKPLLLGALTGFAAQINYLGGFVLAVSTALILAWPLFSNTTRTTLRSFMTAGLLSLGAFIAVVLLTLLPLIVEEELLQYFEMQRAFLGVYQSVLNDDKLLRALFSIAISAGFFVGLFVCIAWSEKSFRNFKPASVTQLAQLANVFVVTLFAILLTKRLYPHYFNLLIVPSTLILLIFLSSASARALRGFAYLAGVLATLLVARGAWDVYLKDWHGNFKQQHEIAKLVKEIRSHTQPGERVLLFNLNHTLYFMANVTPATRLIFRDVIFFDRFLTRIGSSPSQEITKALEKKPVFVMVCFDNSGADYRPLVQKNLATGYREYSLSGYEECRDLKAYYQATNGTSSGVGE